jgi:hypothetical protein
MRGKDIFHLFNFLFRCDSLLKVCCSDEVHKESTVEKRSGKLLAESFYRGVLSKSSRQIIGNKFTLYKVCV